ncbi:MAG: substrate-binding domain-containing protein [Planctomycetes bacterium]|nr:substrate-binding domain-containing protein [Planctomycetota bacterium]
MVDSDHKQDSSSTAPQIRTGTIGCIGSAFSETSGYWAKCLTGIRQAATENNTHLLLLPNEYNANAWDKVDGLILSEPLSMSVPEDAKELPMVSVIQHDMDMYSIVADDEGGAREATEYLLGLGHKCIASLFTPPPNRFGELRTSGYRSALTDAGIEPDKSWSRDFVGQVGGQSFADIAKSIIERWLDENWKETGCTALIAQNDHVAIGAIQAFNSRGMLVPEDVSVMGFDGTEVAQHCMPPLTTVKIPLEEIGERGVKLLLDQIKGRVEKGADKTVVLPTSIKLGDSAALPPWLTEESQGGGRRTR